MGYTITQESFDSLDSYWADLRNNLRWNSVFVLPSWLRVWWQILGTENELYLCAVWQNQKILGIAPLLVKGKTASIVGSADVCDYLDFVVAHGRERDFFTVLLDDLGQKGISQLDMGPLRPDSIVLTNLVTIAKNRKYEVILHEEGVSVELDLPSTWDEYLAILTKKQRHEMRRKLRRLWEADNVDYQCHEVGFLFPAERKELQEGVY